MHRVKVAQIQFIRFYFKIRNLLMVNWLRLFSVSVFAA
jgi:hypothetical protein